MKHCHRCDRILPTRAFHRWNDKRYRIQQTQAWCKTCMITYNRARRRLPRSIKRERWRGICRRLEKKHGLNPGRVRSIRRHLYIRIRNRKRPNDRT